MQLHAQLETLLLAPGNAQRTTQAVNTIGKSVETYSEATRAGTAAVILDLETCRAVDGVEGDPTRARAAVLDHVGDCFAQCPRHGRLMRWIQLSAAHVRADLNARRGQSCFGSYELSLNARDERAGDSLANIAHRRSCKSLYVG